MSDDDKKAKPIDWDALAAQYETDSDGFCDFLQRAVRDSFGINGVPTEVVMLLTATREAVEDGAVALHHLAEAVCNARLAVGLRRDGTRETDEERAEAERQRLEAELGAHRPPPGSRAR